LGISSISRLFEALGYRAAECYGFEDKVYMSRYISRSPSLLSRVRARSHLIRTLGAGFFYFGHLGLGFLESGCHLLRT
jgi:hypothetical protein